MYINKVRIKNFRLLRNSCLDLRDELSLLVGKNNSGKTSLLVLFEKFLTPRKFYYDDFSLALRERIQNLDTDSEINDLAIRMILEIRYDEDDDLENLSEFILDLDPEIKTVKILFECTIDKDSLLKEVAELEADERKNVIIKILDRHLKSKIYVFDDSEGEEGVDKYLKLNRSNLIRKELKSINKLINFHIIHARRNVSSSEESNDRKKPLSAITTDYFNSENEAPHADLVQINKALVEMDATLDERYESFFENFLKNSKNFLNLDRLSVISNIQSKMLFDNSSQVVYGAGDNRLPEHLNGLGYMNILYLLLQIEIKKEDFKRQCKDINLLFIEEPEAHTHPQMQYIFANEIRAVLEEIEGLQTIITSHSSHIVSQSDFEDIRYLKIVNDDNVEIKNFHTELRAKYSGKEEQFKFLKQYLNMQSAELFFASKVIFIEGITERILLPYFIQKFDEKNLKNKEDYIPLASQNISILEIGANAKVFAPFLEFLDIQTLIITDIDTTLKTVQETGTTYKAEPVVTATHTSNETLKYFFDAPEDIHSAEFEKWIGELRDHSLTAGSNNIKAMYQSEELGYHARSFEDAFMKINLEEIKSNKDAISGLKNKKELDDIEDVYKLTEKVLDKKSSFAASLLYLALSDDEIQWETPLYIRDGLSWLLAE